MNMSRTTRFISVEISIRTNFDCNEWIEWFERQDNYVNKFNGDDYKWHVYFDPLPSENANTTICDLCTEIENLPQNIKKQWNQASLREFHVGYHVGENPQPYDEHFELKTLKRAIEMNASIRIAMYPAPHSDC